MDASIDYASQLADVILWGILIGVAVAVVFSRSLIKSLVFLAIFSLITAGLFLSMEAPDVAITEAAIGSAISTLFFLAAFRITGREETGKRKFRFLSFLLLCSILLLLISSVVEMPLYGAADSPASSYVAKHYTENSYSETGVSNMVTSVLASYRGYDTLGEVYVILVAGIGVLLILPLTSWREA
ncbi:MAG: cation:proton antiporter [Alphaproteobacteria bacterium CG11_big_fil_rev_8_21_14_0_20_44_7]|nr:MAG: cation:proton antiporter [Alphaproteobacteria bacterium CG11_big_fil_rev_8_21_14_0_20_44_7]